jgi:SAM-dependent methyltransferase
MSKSAGVADFNDYLSYLKGRSFRGLLYRRFWLYPRLNARFTGRVLDVGCGIGDFLRFRRGTVGVDINPGAVAYCREQGLDARKMETDCLPFADKEFDGAMLDNVLEHIAEPRPVLHEIARVLRPGGTLIVGVPGRRGFASDPDHKVFYDARRLKEVVDRAGFSLHKLIPMPFRSSWLDAHARQYCLYGVFKRS